MAKLSLLSALPLMGSLLFGSSQAFAGDVVQFSADTYQKAPGQGENHGRIFVNKDQVRTEMEQGGQQVIQIMDSAKQLTLVLFPANGSYMEFRAPVQLPQGQVQSGGNPCDGNPGAQCSNQGVESVMGRPAVKWSITMQQQGKVYRTTQWLDKERGIPLKQVGANGEVMEQRLLGSEQLGGRAVEKWEMTASQPNKAPQNSYRWYDPALKLAIKEEIPGVYVRELRNIRVGPQDARLFTVPAGFKKVTPQQGGQGRR